MVKMETELESRRRLNIKESAKGELRYDITIELFNKPNDEAVKQLMDLKEKIERALGR